jgi:hypothetical protein
MVLLQSKLLKQGVSVIWGFPQAMPAIFCELKGSWSKLLITVQQTLILGSITQVFSGTVVRKWRLFTKSEKRFRFHREISIYALMVE